MADFSQAIPKLIRAEGGYQLTNNEHDLGGWTFAGITRRSHPGWVGWECGRQMETGQISKALKAMVRHLYREEYWNRIWGDQIESQEVAESILFWVVLAPMPTVIKTVQRIVGAKPDGVMGPATIDSLNFYIYDNRPDVAAIKKRLFLCELYVKKSDRRVEVSKRKGQINNLRGWLNRARKHVLLK